MRRRERALSSRDAAPPVADLDGPAASAPPGADGREVVLAGRAMATRITLRLPLPDEADGARRAALEAAGQAALEVFRRVEAACSRFDARSPLARANRSPSRWHRAPPELLDAIAEAKRAYDLTGGRMDPRVLRHLVALGYDRTLAFGTEEIRLAAVSTRPGSGPPGPWRPRLRRGRGEVLLGHEPVDLGGIGKGLAVRWAGERLARATRDFLLDAGGDCACAGAAPDGGPWLVGVEDPHDAEGAAGPVAVLALSGKAVATSSTRLRRWRAGGRVVHHLVDPRTGRPGGAGLASVTVVGDDPAMAEAWTKALFLAGRPAVDAAAGRRHLAALWVDEDGGCSLSPEMERYLRWRRG